MAHDLVEGSLATTRRRFLSATGVTGAALGLGLWRSGAAHAADPAASVVSAAAAAGGAGGGTGGRTFVGGVFALELDGISAGFSRGIDGGAITADVIDEPVGPDGVARKHIGGVKYEDITVQAGFGMSKGIYDWIKASLDRAAPRHTLTAQTLDAKLNVASERHFFDALISEVVIPACDGSAKDPAYMTVTFAPESTRDTPPSGKSPGAPPKDRQKTWLPSNFKLTIGDLPCSRVNKIEALVIKQGVASTAIGETRDYEKEPTKVEVPNLVITLPESVAKPFYDWHEDFVINGNNGPEAEKQGLLTLLSLDRKQELATISFTNLGIFKLTPEKVESHSDNIRRVKAEMYCEEIKFDYKATWA